MKQSFLFLSLIILPGLNVFGQKTPVKKATSIAVIKATSIPVIKATSNNVDIKDGFHFRKAYWYIMPEKKPDRYYVELPGKEHAVTFYTDIDSITFNTMYGAVYNF